MWRTYKNELIVGVAFLLLVLGLFYKQAQVSGQVDKAKNTSTSLNELKEVIGLKKVWVDKQIAKKVESIKSVVSPSKVKWKKTGKKVTASFNNLNDRELNNLISKVLSLAVEIDNLEVNRIGEVYKVELKCKW
jgi:methyl coenzyme M reductase subunit C-like uncharacterized protein (methanogenesis marker protein 7)